MSAPQMNARKLAHLLVRHAAWVAPPHRQDWSQAMTHELHHIPQDTSALRWALGCTFVSYLERTHVMTRSLTNLPRWLLSLEMAVCLVPLTWLFLAVVAMMTRGRMPLDYGMLAGSATLVGPVGLVIAFKILFSSAASIGRATATLLVLLAIWSVLAYSGQVLHNGIPFSGWWREWVLMAALPSLAVVHLLQINSERRATAATT